MIGNHVDGANCLKGSNPLLSVTSLPGPLVKRLRHRPFTAVTRVRIPYGSLKILSKVSFFICKNDFKRLKIVIVGDDCFRSFYLIL